MHASPLHPPRRMAWAHLRSRPATAALAAAAAVVLAGGAAVGTLASTAQAASAAALSANWYESAPYYSTLDSNGPDLGSVMSATGQKAFDMAFILASGGSCAPAWDGTDPVSSDTQVASVINEVRADGGDVIVSAGGYNGTKLGQVCSSAATTAAAYQQAITTYGLHAFDFDLEEPEIENSTAIANELGAAQILQQEDPGLFISVTMPSTTTGANYFGQLLLNEAKSLGFTPNDYSIMPFDGGFSGGSSQVTALQDFNSQLMSTFGWSSSQAYAHEGFSGMNGRTDTGEYFYQSDFQTVLSFAESSGISRFTFWSVNRDRQCNPPNNNDVTSSECSSVPQNSWDFTAYTVAFAKNARCPRRARRHLRPVRLRHPRPRRHRPRVDVRQPRGYRTRPTCRVMWCPTVATSGPPTSGTTTKSLVAHQAPGTTTALAETWRRATLCAPPGATTSLRPSRRAGRVGGCVLLASTWFGARVVGWCGVIRSQG